MSASLSQLDDRDLHAGGFRPSADKPELRVLMIFAALGVGGAETWLIALLRYFRQVESNLPVRLKIDICLTSGMQAAFDEEATSLGARLFYIRYGRGRMGTFAREFREVLKHGRYHVIHDHQDYAAGLHFLLGAGLLPPIRVVHVHNPAINIRYFETSLLRLLTLRLGKFLIKFLATHVMGTSRQIVREYGFDQPFFRRIGRGALHCGFDTSRYGANQEGHRINLREEFGWSAESKIILFVGRLDSNCNQKNPRFALEVVRECLRENHDVRCIMAGGGEEAQLELEQLVSGWSLSDKIKLVGARNDVPHLMLGADVLLFPSVAEGLGMVAVEAQAAGLRVVASDSVPRECAVIPEMVEFLPLEAGAQEWAEGVLRSWNLPSPDAEACNRSVRESGFAIENSAQELIRLYRGAS